MLRIWKLIAYSIVASLALFNAAMAQRRANQSLGAIRISIGDLILNRSEQFKICICLDDRI